jgi:shikimate 5-dehydrogenase
MKNDKVIGYNTDYDGFLGLLLTHHIDVKDKKSIF